MEEAKETTTLAFDRSESEILRTGSAIILLAIVLGMAVPAQALGAGFGATSPTVAHPGGGNHGSQSSLPAQRFERFPSMPPVFNQSTPYTVRQSPERPVSPASPGSIFGDH